MNKYPEILERNNVRYCGACGFLLTTQNAKCDYERHVLVTEIEAGRARIGELDRVVRAYDLTMNAAPAAVKVPMIMAHPMAYNGATKEFIAEHLAERLPDEGRERAAVIAWARAEIVTIEAADPGCNSAMFCGKDSAYTKLIRIVKAGELHTGRDLADAMRKLPTEAQREIASFHARAERIEAEDLPKPILHDAGTAASLLAMAAMMGGFGSSLAPPRAPYVGAAGTARNQHAPKASEGRTMSPKTARRRARKAKPPTEAKC